MIPDHPLVESSASEAGKKIGFSEYYPVFGSSSEIRIFPKSQSPTAGQKIKKSPDKKTREIK